MSLTTRPLTICGLFALSGILTAVWTIFPEPYLILIPCLLPLAILFLLNQTFWLVSLFVIFSFFRIHEAFPMIYSFKLPFLLSLGALSALSWHVLISQELKPFWHPSLTWLSLFWFLVFIGIFFASNPSLAIAKFSSVYWKIIIMTFAITWLVDSELTIKRISLMIVIAGILISTVALYNSANGIGLVEGTRVTIGRNLESVLGDPNDLSLVLMFPLAFAISLFLTKNIGMARLLGLVCLVCAMMAVIATQSRGGLLGSLAIFAVFGQKYIRSKFLLLLIGTIASLVLFYAAGIADRQSGGADEEGLGASAMGRLYAWEAAFNMAVENPLTGVGLDNFFANYFFFSPHWDGLNHAVHSTWFGVLAETGFLGLVIFVIATVSLLITSLKTLRTLNKNPQFYSPYLMAAGNAVFAGLIGTNVSGTFLTQGFTWPIYILAALCIALSRIVQIYSQNEKQNTPPNTG
ncbi:hypothetical protein DZ860_20310 [Vibrio sinensis]|uniref:O-antigen ligase-related domain-containing protein n=1 Tax=Vibrio sinensis TaxID=2302434 RepID=A0A3A6QIG4_9VIBR|nr:O-antigen ligase family protein [Vibrio sinensis]RJX66489.1 hypothetical protein DZ860_20310 [Vibrio sinensis]